MENYKLSLQVLSQAQENSEIGLYAKNTVTLCEYATRCHFQTSYLTKLQKWLDKGRYTMNQASSGDGSIELCVQIFSFKLERVERDNLDVLKDEFISIKNLSAQIEREIACFSF
jgi:hypothetical protein